jgi:hypothetical protein
MGYGFSAPFNLSVPNYFFELLAWGAVCAMSGSIAGTCCPRASFHLSMR